MKLLRFKMKMVQARHTLYAKYKITLSIEHLNKLNLQVMLRDKLTL